MSAVIGDITTRPITIRLGSVFKNLTDEEFFELCRANDDLRIERNSEGDLIIMPPTGGKTGNRNSRLIARLNDWVERDGSGIIFDSSTMFKLPNGADRSPDLAWVLLDRWNRLTDDEQESFPPICPDFVVELRSPSDHLPTLLEKMDEYIANGAQLGWLIDPFDRRVFVYRPNRTAEVLDDPIEVSGDPLLAGFTLKLADIW